MMPRAAVTAKRGAHVACTVAALHDGMPVAVRSAGGTSAAPTTYAIVYLAPAVVVRGTGGRRAGGGGLGVDDVASDGFSTQFERCTAQIRALLGALAVQLLHDVGEEASRGRRLAPRLVPPKGPGVILFGAVNRSVGICF